MTERREPRKFSEELKCQVVELYDNGKLAAGIRGERDVGGSTPRYWARAIYGSGSTGVADNRRARS